MVNVEGIVFFKKNVPGPWLLESKDVPSMNLAGSLQVCIDRRQGRLQ